MKKLSVIQADNITIGLTLIYLYMAKNMCETFGIEGESAVRKGLAEYATVRGSDLRKKHMALGMKTNLKNFFYYGSNPYSEASFTGSCWLFFGKETAGLPEWLREKYRDRCVRIPMVSEARSLNLSNAAAVLTYEALRQQGFKGLLDYGQMKQEE